MSRFATWLSQPGVDAEPLSESCSEGLSKSTCMTPGVFDSAATLRVAARREWVIPQITQSRLVLGRFYADVVEGDFADGA
jgi:hypothetical protein